MDKLVNNIEPRTILLAMISSVLLISAALFSYVIWPEVKDYKDSVNTRTLLEKHTGKEVDLDREIAELQSHVDSLQKELLGDTASLPENQLEAFIIGQLQSISWRNNIQLLGVKPGRGGNIHKFQELQFKIGISGDYLDLFSWLNEMNEKLRFVVLKDFALRPLEWDKKDPRLKMELTIASYRNAEDA